MFKSATDPLAQELLDQVKELSRQVARLQGESDAIDQRRSLMDERDDLQTQIQTLTIERDRKEEDFARQRREVEHSTGLHRKQSEWERQKAVEEAKLTVQQENLSLDRQRFEDQLAFSKEQIKAEVDRLEKLVGGLMERLPIVTIEKSIALTGNGNGPS